MAVDKFGFGAVLVMDSRISFDIRFVNKDSSLDTIVNNGASHLFRPFVNSRNVYHLVPRNENTSFQSFQDHKQY